MPKFEITTAIPVQQIRYDYFEIEADSLKEAKQIALSRDCWNYYVDCVYSDDEEVIGTKTVYDYRELSDE